MRGGEKPPLVVRKGVKMEFPERVKLLIGMTAGTIGLFIAQVPEAVTALVLLMAIDIATGVISAGIRGKLSSEASWHGLKRKVLTLLMVATAWVLERYLPVQLPVSFTTAIALFYCAHEGLSILENVAEAGVPVPRALRDALARLKDDQESDGNSASRDSAG
ncbi:phage holin family protein [Thermomicrobium sp.]|uniref:phage holin family protein n=1 Tax=Thermomicrobium sp. TaxID=1969469 RepID=UPI001B0D02F0|nr:phage holin family protein [Thermomicrobium sp.]MBO9308120.1 phage holin family protein [Thermomicrobium sp.]